MRHLKGTNLWVFFRKVGDANGTPFCTTGAKTPLFLNPPPRYITRVGIPQCSHARQPSAVCKRNSSSDRQKVKGEREVSMGTTGLGERERQWWCGSALMSQTTFCFACHRGDPLSAWLEGTQTARANKRNISALRCAFPRVWAKRRTCSPLVGHGREIKSERGRYSDPISNIARWLCFSTIWEHPPAALSGAFRRCISWSCSLEFMSTTEIQFPSLDPYHRCIAEWGGLRNLKYYFLKSWGKVVGGLSRCLWGFRSLRYRFSVQRLSSTSHVASWRAAGAHTCISAVQPHQNVYRFFTRPHTNLPDSCRPTHTHTHTHKPNKLYSGFDPDTIYPTRCMSIFSHNCIILSAD